MRVDSRVGRERRAGRERRVGRERRTGRERDAGRERRQIGRKKIYAETQFTALDVSGKMAHQYWRNAPYRHDMT